MPSYPTIVTFVVGVGFLLFGGIPREARFLFPAWVLLLSVYILVMSFRLTCEQQGEEELSIDSGS